MFPLKLVIRDFGAQDGDFHPRRGTPRWERECLKCATFEVGRRL